MIRDEIGNRMKTYYEEIPKTRLMHRTPVAIRLDGRSFHTFTRGFQKPFDEVLIKSMQNTMKYLCENIQGCVLGYHQSDEITLILIDYQNLNTSAWFDYEVQKMCSIAASMATMAFNKAFAKTFDEWGRENLPNWDDGGTNESVDENLMKLCQVYYNAQEKGAMFDARCFNIPKEEVTNLIYWRQLDATRNSIQMVGQANFSHKELQNKSCNNIQDMLIAEKGINWNDFPTHQKRGSCCVRKVVNVTTKDICEEQEWGDPIIKTMVTTHYDWVIDTEIPLFKNEGRDYIDNLIFIENEV